MPDKKQKKSLSGLRLHSTRKTSRMNRNYLRNEEVLQEKERVAIEDMKQLSKDMVRGAKHLLILYIPWFVRGGCIGMWIFGSAYAFERLWPAFGGDPIALIPAVLFAILPGVIALIEGSGYGGMAVTGMFCMLEGSFLPRLPVEMRIFAICLLIGLFVIVVLKGVTQLKKEDSKVEVSNEERK